MKRTTPSPTGIDLKALLAERKATPSGPKLKFPAEVREKRAKEQTYRANTVRNMTVDGMRAVYPEVWTELWRQATEIVNAERGPLPGDDVAS